MEQLFYPKSVVIIGVSEDPGNLGRTIVENLDRFSYAGLVHLVGRKGGSLGDRPICRTLEEVPGLPDLAVILIPAQHVPDALEACGRKGIRWVVVESGGFGEYSEGGRQAEGELLAIARRHGIRFVGPNCISVVNLDNGLVLPFMKIDPEMTRRGPVSLVSQSGGVVFGGIKLFSCEDVGFNKLVSIGNKLDLDESDYLEYLTRDPSTEVIGLYLESVSRGRRLLQLAASTEKPIVVLKANRTPGSHQIASFHTAALAGDDAVCGAAFAQAGLHRVETMAEMTDLFKVFQLPPMAGPNLAVLGRSGGQSVMAADAAAAMGFRLPPLSEALMVRIRERVRAGVIRLANPLDLGDIFDLAFYRDVVEGALEDPGVDGVLFQHLHSRGVETEATMALLGELLDLARRHRKPVAVCFMCERDEWFTVKAASPIPLFLEPHGAVRALAASLRHSTRRAPEPVAPVTPVDGASPVALAEPEAVFGRLRDCGIPVAPWARAEDPDAAVAAAGRLGYPVALKIASARVVHKTEAGGVVLDQANADAVAVAATEMQRRFSEGAAGRPPALLVQAMAPKGVEMILGARRDPEFGPVVLLGLGGVAAEVLRDVTLRVAPVSEAEADEMIRELRGYPVLRGFRGAPPADLAALARTVAAFSRLLVESPEIAEAEVNPLIVLEEGRGCVAVDGRMRVCESRGTRGGEEAFAA